MDTQHLQIYGRVAKQLKVTIYIYIKKKKHAGHGGLAPSDNPATQEAEAREP